MTDLPTPGQIVFGILCVWVLASALGVVLLRNVLHAAGAMMVCFIGVAAMYVTLKCELLAALQIVLYVGAITVLILFGVMLTVRRMGDLREQWNRKALQVAPPVLFVLGVFAVSALTGTEWAVGPSRQVFPAAAVADRLFKPDGWVVPFEIVGIVLLAALVGAIVLARRERKAG